MGEQRHAYSQRPWHQASFIRSFNEDKRFDQFIVEQLAGDLLPGESLEQRREQVEALGFLSVGPKMLACDDPDLFAWFMGHAKSSDPALQALVQLILDRVRV